MKSKCKLAGPTCGLYHYCCALLVFVIRGGKPLRRMLVQNVINCTTRKVFWWVEYFQSDMPSVIDEDHFGSQPLWLHMLPKAFFVNGGRKLMDRSCKCEEARCKVMLPLCTS